MIQITLNACAFDVAHGMDDGQGGKLTHLAVMDPNTGITVVVPLTSANIDTLVAKLKGRPTIEVARLAPPIKV